MSLFNRTRNRDEQKRASLESFKARAEAASVVGSIDKITGGALADCHGGGKLLA
jgi:hypothetical protein